MYRIQNRSRISRAALQTSLRALAFGVVLLIPQAVLAQAFSFTVTVQRNFNVPPTTLFSDFLVATCPTNFVAVGGGVDLLDTDVVGLDASFPAIGAKSLLLVADGAAAAPNAWGAFITNRGTKEFTVSVSAICSAVTGVSTVVRSVTVPAKVGTTPGRAGVLRADCPAGQVALGGGAAAAGAAMRITTSAPTFGADVYLADRPAGTNPAPTGWAATTTPNTQNLAATFKVAVTCAQTSTVLTVVRAAIPVAPAKAADEAIVCPAGYVATGGGIDTSDRENVIVLVNSPVYNAYGYAADRSSGTYAAAAGWIGITFNQAGATKNMVVAAVCARSVAAVDGSIVAVYEFYNQNLKHYFRTSSAAEAKGIANGSAGPGWIRTGDNFVAYTAGFNATGSDVCRFYTFGANSHFYTAFADECAGLKAPTTGWVYEGLSFRIPLPTTPTVAGCTGATVPVYRLYNDRFASNDSNHRFTTIAAEVTRLQALKWKNEGVAFCALDFSSGEP